MSQVPSTSTSAPSFETIFAAALKDYKKQTKKDIASHPLAAELNSCDSPNAVLTVLQTQVQTFDPSESANERWTKLLDPTVTVLYTFSTFLNTAVGPIFPPAAAIFTGISVLLQAVKDVRASQDVLIELFRRMEFFFKRTEAYIKVRPTTAMMDIIVQIMVEVISILGVVTKEIRQGRIKKYLKTIFGIKRVEDALQRLDKLTQEEALMAATEVLTITRGIDDTVKVMDDKLDGVDMRIQDVDGVVKAVDHTVKAVDHAVKTIDYAVQDLGHRVRGVDRTMTGVDCGVNLLGHSVKGVRHVVQGMSREMKGVDRTVKGIDDKVGLVIDGVMNTGLAIQQVSDQVYHLNWSELRKDLRKWINPPDPSVNYNAATSTLHEGTATWCLKGKTLDWKASGSLLWIHGKPGSGKTILSSVIIRDIKSMSNAGSAFLAYFYFDFKDTSKQDYRAILSSLLIQLSDQSDMFCNALFSLYSANKRGSEQATDDSLARCLKDMLTMKGRMPIYLIIDALDECPNDSGIPSSREKVLDLIKELVELRHPNLRLCITSRPEFDIHTMLEPLATQRLSHHDESGQKQDIIDYVTFVVRSDKKMSKWRDDEKNMVIEKLTRKADGMFRWVFCQLEVLRHCFPANLRCVLEELPKSLDETYKRILKDINNANRVHAYRLLQCLMVASRPLLVEELAEMLAFDLTTGGISKFNKDWRSERQEEAVLSACSSLVSIIIENGSRVVQFSHFSVKEFLTSDRLASCIEDVSWFHIPIEPSHVILAQACLSVLLCLNDYTGGESAEKLPLLRYAAEYWHQHVEIGNVESQITEALDYFFDMERPHFSAWVRVQGLQDLLKVSLLGEELRAVPLPAAPLYFAAWRGFRGLVERLMVKHSEQVNHFGGQYGTPLHASVLGGHIVVSQLLCTHGAQIHSCSADNLTPLHIASLRGDLEIGKWLLTHGADLNSWTKDGFTPLYFAALKGHLGFTQMLLKRNAVVNSRNDEGDTPLLIASEHGTPDVVLLLLDHNADVHAHTNSGHTPLHCAACRGHLEISRILLERNAEVNCRNDEGTTPLLLASEHGTPDVVRLLLDHNADVHATGYLGRTPLHGAAFKGRLEISRILLKRNVEVNSRDDEGSTPLLLASEYGFADVVLLLLDHNADVHAHTNSGRTPLHCAAQRGHLEISQILLERNAEVNSQDEKGSTPLLLASEHGTPDVVRLLLDHNADLRATEYLGRTPLHCAACKGHLEISRILLERNAEVDSRDDKGSTPLHLASEHGTPDVVWLLLDYNADVHATEIKGRTPLHYAAFSSRLEISRILLERNVEVSPRDDNGYTPLHFASVHGTPDVVQLLLDHNADVHATEIKGRTPLHCAAFSSHLEISRMLLERNVEVNSGDDEGSTPLLLASIHGTPDVVRLSLDHNADVHATEYLGRTPLHCAAYRGHLEISRILLERNVEVNSRDNHEYTPLLLASEFGALDVVQSLLDHHADVHVHDGDGDSPLHCVAARGKLDVARVLLKRNVEVNSRNNNGSTPLHLASAGYEEGWPEFVRLLLDHGADAQARNLSGQTASEVARGPKREEIVQLLSQHAAE